MSVESFFVVASMFLFGLLTLLYGEKVNHPTISLVMGTMTLIVISLIPAFVLMFMLI